MNGCKDELQSILHSSDEYFLRSRITHGIRPSYQSVIDYMKERSKIDVAQYIKDFNAASITERDELIIHDNIIAPACKKPLLDKLCEGIEKGIVEKEQAIGLLCVLTKNVKLSPSQAEVLYKSDLMKSVINELEYSQIVFYYNSEAEENLKCMYDVLFKKSKSPKEYDRILLYCIRDDNYIRELCEAGYLTEQMITSIINSKPDNPELKEYLFEKGCDYGALTFSFPHTEIEKEVYLSAISVLETDEAKQADKNRAINLIENLIRKDYPSLYLITQDLCKRYEMDMNNKGYETLLKEIACTTKSAMTVRAIIDNLNNGKPRVFAMRRSIAKPDEEHIKLAHVLYNAYIKKEPMPYGWYPLAASDFILSVIKHGKLTNDFYEEILKDKRKIFLTALAESEYTPDIINKKLTETLPEIKLKVLLKQEFAEEKLGLSDAVNSIYNILNNTVKYGGINDQYIPIPNLFRPDTFYSFLEPLKKEMKGTIYENPIQILHNIMSKHKDRYIGINHDIQKMIDPISDICYTITVKKKELTMNGWVYADQLKRAIKESEDRIKENKSTNKMVYKQYCQELRREMKDMLSLCSLREQEFHISQAIAICSGDIRHAYIKALKCAVIYEEKEQNVEKEMKEER